MSAQHESDVTSPTPADLRRRDFVALSVATGVAPNSGCRLVISAGNGVSMPLAGFMEKLKSTSVALLGTGGTVGKSIPEAKTKPPTGLTATSCACMSIRLRILARGT